MYVPSLILEGLIERYYQCTCARSFGKMSREMALHSAAEMGDIVAMEQILAANPEALNEQVWSNGAQGDSSDDILIQAHEYSYKILG